jgi:hypothetical protein
MLDKELRNFDMSVLRRQMQRGQPILVLDCRISAMLDKELRDFNMSVL